MRVIKIYEMELVIVPKPLRKRFANLHGVFIEKDGSRAGCYSFKTNTIQWLPAEFVTHFRKCVTNRKQN